MPQELHAYLIRDNEHVRELPTDELLLALDQLHQEGHASDRAAVYEFLQATKRIMRTGVPVAIGCSFTEVIVVTLSQMQETGVSRG